MTTVITSIKYSDGSSDSDIKTKGGSSIPPLGEPFHDTKKYFWQKAKDHDLDAIATQPSVYDDPVVSEKYKPRSDWENLHRFNPLARWTWREEKALVRKIDKRIMIWTCIMFMGLEIDRANISQAVSDNMLDDLGLTTMDFNLGITVFAVSFLAAELPSQLVSKWIVLYLSYFYTHAEMTLRLGCFFLAMTSSDILAALLGAGLLRMRGVLGYAGWRWMFLIEGLLTLVIGLCSFILMPASPTETAGNLRGKKGWFTEREEEIMVNRVIRDDPTKGTMHNRQPITPRLLLKSILDYDLWPMYLIGMTYLVPVMPPGRYLTLSLRGLGFSTFETNLLSIPNQILGMCSLVLFVWCAERYKQLLMWAALAQVWILPFLIWLRAGYDVETSKWTTWVLLTLLLSKPMLQPLQMSIVSRNSNGVRLRTVSAALYNMFVQLSQVIGANIYTLEDAPLYRKGNSALIGLVCWNLLLYAFAKAYYELKNRSRDKKWKAMSSEEQLDYIEKNPDLGNKRLDFRFAT
ncbi:related to permease of the major facilitator superfamily [Cephalotrichum gorgonifer]|uniref:Related to permease of the major facilitator superfamily n=1 Tax=Cephalotrichum gorgonifer TaxID=2041049 RepID=A0AAE8MW96_9PEZI|nr:related to permease of the major facilitator superfamily [Cephalotrichum gorgonifer]